MGILENLKILLAKPEIVTLIIGTILGAVLGATLTFSFNRWEKYIEFKKEKEKAIMCLKIELNSIERFSNSMLNAESKFGNMIPDQDFPVFNLTAQSQQFMFYNEKLATKIYELAMNLGGINKRRKAAYALIKHQENPDFILNANMYKNELKETRRLIKEINSLI